MIEVEQAGVEMAGHSRLEQIRASMRGEALPAGGAASDSAAAPGTPAAAPHGRAHREAPRSVEDERVDGGAARSQCRMADIAAARPRHGQRPFRAGRPEDQRRHRSAGTTAASPASRAALGSDLRCGMRVLGCGDGDPGGVGLVRAAAGDHRRSRCRASDDRHAAADPLPLAEGRAAAAAAAHQHSASAAAEFGGPTGDVRARRFRAGLLLAARRHGARQHAARHRDSAS